MCDCHMAVTVLYVACWQVLALCRARPSTFSNNLKQVRDFHLEAKARIWPGLCSSCHDSGFDCLTCAILTVLCVPCSLTVVCEHVGRCSRCAARGRAPFPRGEEIQRVVGVFPGGQGQSLALTVLCVPCSELRYRYKNTVF